METKEYKKVSEEERVLNIIEGALVELRVAFWKCLESLQILEELGHPEKAEALEEGKVALHKALLEYQKVFYEGRKDMETREIEGNARVSK